MLVVALWQGPSQSRLLETEQILVYGTLAELNAAGDLPLRQFQVEVQPQHVIDFSHGDSLSGHPFI